MNLSRILVFISLLSFAAALDSARDLLAAGRVDDAITALQGQISARPENAESYNLLCRAYFSVGDWDHAVSYCDKAVRLEPNNSRPGKKTSCRTGARGSLGSSQYRCSDRSCGVLPGSTGYRRRRPG